MGEERTRALCRPVAWGPAHTADSVIRWCEVCSAPVWCAPSTLALGAVPICLDCAPGVLSDDEILMAPTEQQRAELAQHGISPTEAERAARFVHRDIVLRRPHP